MVYLETHFPNHTVLEASFDNHRIYKKYKIFLKDQISLGFSPEYKVIEIKLKSKLLNSVIPEAILKYVEANFPNNVIADLELDNGNQQVELDDGTDLVFNLKGEFLKIEN